MNFFKHLGLEYFISVITFPGIIVYQLAKQICCRICRVIVYDVKYYSFKRPHGYVIHENIDNEPWKKIFLIIGSFFINLIVGVLLTFVPGLCINGCCEIIWHYNVVVDIYMPFFLTALCWIGISVLVHMIPNVDEAKILTDTIIKNKEVGILAKIVTVPLVGITYFWAFLSLLCWDILLSVGIAFQLPYLVSLML